MNEMTRLVQNHDYLTPRIAENLEFQNLNFTNMFEKTDWSRSAVVCILRDRIGSMSYMCFIRDARMLFFHMMRPFIIMV